MPKLYLSADALISNFHLLKAKTGGALIPVLKADAYGHGASFVLESLLAVGVELFAVATAFEGLELLKIIEKSKVSFTKPQIIIMSAVEPEALFPLLSPSVILSVHSPIYARFLSNAVAHFKEKCLLPAGFRLSVHLKLETGMHRTGIRTEDGVRFVLSLPHLSVEGAYSHLACPEDSLFTKEQHRRFLALSSLLPSGSFTHLSASGGLLKHGDFSLCGVRVGLALYGVAPWESELPLSPVMRFSARVLSVFRVNAGAHVGYGHVRTKHPRRIAILDAGYADGIPPTASEGGWVEIKGRKCPFFGAVCMDKTTVDVENIPLREGEEIPLFGSTPGDTAVFARAAGVSPYVLLCHRSARTKRIYLKEE